MIMIIEMRSSIINDNDEKWYYYSIIINDM